MPIAFFVFCVHSIIRCLSKSFLSLAIHFCTDPAVNFLNTTVPLFRSCPVRKQLFFIWYYTLFLGFFFRYISQGAAAIHSLVRLSLVQTSLFINLHSICWKEKIDCVYWLQFLFFQRALSWRSNIKHCFDSLSCPFDLLLDREARNHKKNLSEKKNNLQKLNWIKSEKGKKNITSDNHENVNWNHQKQLN